jgi:uncharacterized membrane protein YfcA
LVRYLIPFTIIGAILGVLAALRVPSENLKPLVLALVLVVGIYSLFSKSIGQENNFQGTNTKKIIIGMIFVLVLGFYDGFFGPGTGSFLIFGFIGIYGFDFLNAGGNARIINFTSNVTSLVVFALQGKVDYKLGIPVALCMIVGARFGTLFALKRGSKFIKPIFITMSLAVAGKMLIEIIK